MNFSACSLSSALDSLKNLQGEYLKQIKKMPSSGTDMRSKLQQSIRTPNLTWLNPSERHCHDQSMQTWHDTHKKDCIRHCKSQQQVDVNLIIERPLSTAQSCI